MCIIIVDACSIAAVYMVGFDAGLFCKSNDLIESVLQGNETPFCVLTGIIISASLANSL